MFAVLTLMGDSEAANELAQACGCEVVYVEEKCGGACRMGVNFDRAGLVKLALAHARGALVGECFDRRRERTG
jgi:hypothetical protein